MVVSYQLDGGVPHEDAFRVASVRKWDPDRGVVTFYDIDKRYHAIRDTQIVRVTK